MASSILRSRSSIHRLLRTQNLAQLKGVAKESVSPYRFQHHHQLFGFSNLSKRGKGFDASAPNLLSPPLGWASFRRIGLVSWYVGMVKSHPILTKSVTCTLIYVAADLSSQTIDLPSSGTYDLIRTSRMAAYGLIILGPTLHFWFKLMSRVLPRCDIISTTKKMVLGQLTCGPLLTVIFFSMNSALQGEHYTDIVARLKRDLLPTLLNGVMYWVPCDFIIFKFVPVHLQPLVSNGFMYIWTVYLTYVASLEKAS